MEIRPYREEDEPTVVGLWSRVFEYSSRPHRDPRLSIRKKLAVQRELFLVAEVDGALVGTVMGGYDGHRGWIYSLAVDPDRQRQGIATVLVQCVEQGLARLGCSKINLQVFPDNQTVVEFYRAVGYEVEPRISMGKVLPEADQPVQPS